MEDCCFCNQSLSDGRPTVELGVKGSDGVNLASKQRASNINVHPGQVVHVKCRRDFCEPNRIAKDVASKHVTVEEERTSLRSLQPLFDFKKHCMFCGQPAKYEGKKRYVPSGQKNSRTLLHRYA